MRYLVLVGAMVVFASGQPALGADKTDIVEFGNGSRMIGEVKRLERGKLSFKTDSTDTITIDWKDVTKLVSKQTVRLERSDGTFLFGTLAEPDAPNTIAIGLAGGNAAVPLLETVSLNPIEDSIWERLDIDTSVGYAFTKATEVEQFNFNADFDYETEQRSRSFEVSSQHSQSGSDDSSSRNVVTYQTYHLLEERWFRGWLANFESNDALGLEYRVTGAAIRGRSFYPSTDMRIRAFGGVGVNEERFNQEDSQQSLEGVLGVSIDWFRFSHPELDFTSTLGVLPSLTELGRVRASLNTTLKWEIYEDLYWRLDFFDDFDTDARPDDEGEDDEAKNDYGITTSIGWTW